MTLEVKKKQREIRELTKAIKLWSRYAYSGAEAGVVLVTTTNAAEGTVTGISLDNQQVTVSIFEIVSGEITKEQNPEYWL